MAGLRHTYVTIMGIVMISYGIILNMLGAIASFLHPGSYHQGAMGTPMWCGLLFILFGSVNIVKGTGRKREQRGIPVLLPVINILTLIVSTLCIALISWSMSASGIALLTNDRVTEISVTSQWNSTSTRVSDLQLSLVPIYSTIISSTSLIMIMAMIGLCMDCVGVVSQAMRSPMIAAEVRPREEWEEPPRDGRKYPIIDDEAAPPYHHGDVVGEVTYGHTPYPAPPVQIVKTIERPNFHQHMEHTYDNHNGALQPLHKDHAHETNHAHHGNHVGHAHHTNHVSHSHHSNHVGHTHKGKTRHSSFEIPRSRHVAVHEPRTLNREQRNKQSTYQNQPNSAPNIREVERGERRPNPYFYL